MKDKEFADELARCLANALGRPPLTPKKSAERYAVEAGSMTLYELLKKPAGLDRLKPHIEPSARCMAAFL